MTDKKSLNEKLNSLSLGKKLLVIGCLLAIFVSLFLLTTIDKIETLEYSMHGEVLCTETYINGELNGTPCPQNEVYYPKQPQWQFEIDSLNLT